MKKRFNHSKTGPKVKSEKVKDNKQDNESSKPSKKLKLAKAMAALDDGYESS